MSSMRTRRQAAIIADSDADSITATPSKSTNGRVHEPDSQSFLSTVDDEDDVGLGEEAGEEQENIFLFIPNLIGYSRIALALASLHYMPLHPRTCSLLYTISCLLDALDGLAARHFDQSTRFGAVLDMVTDRCTTACLLVFLSSAFPRWAIVFQGLISLDLASHYMHMYATLAMGGSGGSHKSVEKSRSWILNLYYSNNKVLFLFCACNEVFFLALYLLSFSSPILSPSLLLNGDASSTQPGNPAKPHPTTLFASPWSAGALEMARANKMDSFWPWVLAGATAPVMAGKQFVNVVQLVKAARWLAEGDLRVRRERRGIERRVCVEGRKGEREGQERVRWTGGLGEGEVYCIEN